MSIKRKKKSKKVLILGVVATVLILGLIAVPMLGGGKSPYTEEIVKRNSIETYFTFSGNVESKNTDTVIASNVMHLSEIKVKEGEKVKKNTVLFVTASGEEITSKISGEVTELYVEENEAVMSGTRLCEIIDFENLQTTLKVDEYDLSSIEVGKKIEIKIGAIDKEIISIVSKISKTAITQSGVSYFTATVNLPYDDKVRVGMTVEAKILNKKTVDAVTVSMKALQFDDDGTVYVLLKDGKGKPIEQYIKAGINNGKVVEVTDGLSVGNTLLLPKNDSSSGGIAGGMIPPIPGR